MTIGARHLRRISVAKEGGDMNKITTNAPSSPSHPATLTPYKQRKRDESIFNIK